MVSNLIVIPGAMVIIGLGILLFLASGISFLAAIIGSVLNTTIFAMNWIVKGIDSFPASLIEGISISIMDCWMIYFILLFLVWSKESRRLLYLNIGLVLFTILLIKDHIEDYSNKDHREIVFYSIKGEPNINFIDGTNNYLICSQKLINDRSTMLFNIKHHWYDLDLNTPTHFEFGVSIGTNALKAQNNLYQFHNKIVYHIVDQVEMDTLGTIDFLYISSSSYISIEELLAYIDPEQIILSNSCHWKTRKEINSLENSNYHDVKLQGAFVKTF